MFKNIFFYLSYQLGRWVSVGGIPVLLYHSISDSDWQFAVSPADFNRQIGWLNGRYICVTTKDVVDWVEGRKTLASNSIAITFDDGYADVFTQALPILRRYDFKATVFVTGNRQPNRRVLGNTFTLLNGFQLKSLVREGWGIESHSQTHQLLTELNRQLLDRELRSPLQAIRKITQKDVTSIAYPKGVFNELVKEGAARYYRAAWSIVPGFNRQNDDLYALKRIEVKRDTSLMAFKAHLTKTVEFIQGLKRWYGKK